MAYRDAKSSRNRVPAGLVSLIVFALMVLPAYGWQDKSGVKHEIQGLERQWRTAQLAGDVATMDKMLSDDYVGISMTGQVNTKAQQLARIRNHSFALTRLDLQDVKVRLVGEIAVVTVKARVEGMNKNRRVDGICRYTRVYHHLPDGAWKITNFEVTRLPRSEPSTLSKLDLPAPRG